MHAGLEVMKVALRVLTALTHRMTPLPADLDALRQYAPDANDLAAGELACEVIQRASRTSGHSELDDGS
jgi:hypothetical protein